MNDTQLLVVSVIVLQVVIFPTLIYFLIRSNDK